MSRDRNPRSAPSSEQGIPESMFLGVPYGVLVAEHKMLKQALDRTRVAKDKRAEAAALRCIARIEAALLAREEC